MFANTCHESIVKTSFKNLPSISNFAHSEHLLSLNSPNWRLTFEQTTITIFIPLQTENISHQNSNNQTIKEAKKHEIFQENFQRTGFWERKIHLGRLEFLLGAVDSADPGPPALDDGALEFITSPEFFFSFFLQVFNPKRNANRLNQRQKEDQIET